MLVHHATCVNDQNDVGEEPSPHSVELTSVFSRECIITMPPYVRKRGMIEEAVSSLAKAGRIPKPAIRRLVSLCFEEPIQSMPADEQAALL